VLAQCGVRYLIILAGINDIGGANANLQTAEGLISAYNTFIKQAHQKDILVYGATILPFGGSIYDNPQKEQLRQTINEWIRTSGEFDAVVDWDVVICDPGNPERIFSLYDSGDHLHLSPEGYKELAGTIDLNLF
jgi:lysophospholipase L1-like esterase